MLKKINNKEHPCCYLHFESGNSYCVLTCDYFNRCIDKSKRGYRHLKGGAQEYIKKEKKQAKRKQELITNYQ